MNNLNETNMNVASPADRVKCQGLWMILIVLLGLALRLAALLPGGAFAYFAFGDEILAYDRAVDYAMGVDEALYLSHAKFTHVSHMPGSLWATFWFNAMRFGGGPHAVAGVMMALNVAVMIFVYLLGCRMLGGRGGLWSALFMATQPWAVYYAVGAYNPEIMAFFSSLTLLALWDAVTRPRSLHIFWVGLLPILALHFHGSAIALIISVLVVMCLAREKLHWPAFGLGLLTGILSYWPYFQLDGANAWHNTRLLFGGEKYYSFSCLKAITTPLSLLMSWCPRWTLPDFSDYMAMGDAVFGSFLVMFIFKSLATLVAAVLIYLFLRLCVVAWRATPGGLRRFFARDPALGTVLVFWLMPVIVFLLSFKNYSSRYAVFQLPVLMMIPAFALTRGKTAICRSIFFRLALAVTVIFNVYFVFGFFNYQGRLISGDVKFIPSFRHLESVYRILKEDAGQRTPIKVEAGEYLAAHYHPEAEAVGAYVGVREKEAGMRGLIDSQQVPVVFELISVASPLAGGEHPVYREADIQLIRRVGND